MTHTPERFEKVNDLLVHYSLGDFDYKIEISPELDDIDTLILGISMLGEELKDTTISKNYFNDIFHSVSDMVIILSQSGTIENINDAVVGKLGYTKDQILNKTIHFLANVENKNLVKNIDSLIGGLKILAETEAVFSTCTGDTIPVLCSVNVLKSASGVVNGYIIVAKDIAKQKETENLIIRTIVNTQEQERTRVARDLHDSLGQQLSAINFYLGTLATTTDSTLSKEILQKSTQALGLAMKELRSVCFNLMPHTLENSNIANAIQELCNKWGLNETLSINFIPPTSYIPLDKSFEIAIFRIVQEFINNAIKHGEASKISIVLEVKKDYILLVFEDNGKGFDTSKIKTDGMGMKNITSRIKSYNGTLVINTAPNRGTSYTVNFPIPN